MILVDTPVWIDHMRAPNLQLVTLAEAGEIICHPLVIAELALGSLKNRARTLQDFDNLASAEDVGLEELRVFIEQEELYSKGIGVVDATLLASCLLRKGTKLWTHDRRLNTLADQLGIAYQPLH